MRRAFQSRLKSIDHHARAVRRVRVERVGGFQHQSYKLRYHLDLTTDTEPRHIVLRGSSERHDATRRRAYEVMRHLWRVGFSDGPYQIARPVTFFQRWKLLVYAEASGTLLTTVLRRHPERGPVIMRQIAGWMAMLHQVTPKNFRRPLGGRGQSYWADAFRVLSAGVSRQDRRQLQVVVRHIQATEKLLSRGQNRVLVHHDFHPENILVMASGIRVIDFTEARFSHPLIDVATFIHQLRLQLGSTARERSIAQWRSAFLRTYHHHHPAVAVNGRSAQRLFSFVAYRISLQSLMAQKLFGRPGNNINALLQSSPWTI